MKRPSVFQWLAYAFGRRLSDDLRDWVRHDLTGRHAFARHLFRGMVPFTPIFGVFMLFPGPWWLRAQMVALGLILALIYSAAYMAQNRSHRLGRHGLDPDLRPVKRQQEHDRDQLRYETRYPRVVTVTEPPQQVAGPTHGPAIRATASEPRNRV